ncbi:MAG: energy-coupling factor transporter ATPase [Firmicutes bacterium]|nr:energy-coupling factor transporter ATPase [Bacillota bacterium]
MPVVIENLNFTYSKKSAYENHALKDINLRIEDGEFFGIIGHTGSGKTTLIGHLNALLRIQAGSITVDDIVITPKNKKKLDFKKLRATLGMVFQYPEHQLFDETVERDVSYGPKNLKLSKEEVAARAKEAIEMVGLNYEEIKNRSPFDLSGGQKRRAAIAGVLAMHPKILVLDEPTAGLDPRGKKEILELISSIRTKICPTVIMISHNMDEIAALADRIAVMHEGKLVCVKKPCELFSETRLLDRLNIKMPQVTEIALRLAKAGISVGKGIVREDELTAAILSAVKGGIS